VAPLKANTCLGIDLQDGHISAMVQNSTFIRRLSVRKYVTLHTYGFVGFFKPTMAEVAKQLPARLFDDFEEIYVTTNILSDDLAHVTEHHIVVMSVAVRDKHCQ
jgi:hypothetical protein